MTINFNLYIFMSFLYFGNTPASVPPVLDTTPCMKEMLNYEDCVYEYALNYSVQMCPILKSFIPHGPQFGPDFLPTAKLLSTTPKSWSIKLLMIISSWDLWPRKPNNFYGSAKKKDSYSRLVSEKSVLFREVSSTQAGILHQFLTCSSLD